VDFHLLSKHRWNEEVVWIVTASKKAQQRMVDWSPELARLRYTGQTKNHAATNTGRLSVIWSAHGSLQKAERRRNE
jgi:hypothetical protein